MNEPEKPAKDFIGYEYKEITADNNNRLMLLDCYKNFGWITDEVEPFAHEIHQTTLTLRRDRKIINRTELTRLQRHFEACLAEIKALEKAKTLKATWCAIALGLVGTAFIAGSTFAITAHQPMILLCVLLAIPGFIGWALPYFLFRALVSRQSKKMQPLIEAKQEEIYEVCEKGHSLL